MSHIKKVTCFAFIAIKIRERKKKLTVPPLDVRYMQHVMCMVLSFHSKCESMKSQLRIYCKPIVLIPVLSVHLFSW